MTAWRAFRSGILLLGLGVFCLVPRAEGSVKILRHQAETLEAQGEWERACEVYEALCRLDRQGTDWRRRYQHCLRRAWQVRRHKDVAYHREVLSLDYGQALRLFTIVYDTLVEYSLDKKKAEPGRLWHKSLEELGWALEDAVFCQLHLPDVKKSAIRQFKASLEKIVGASQATSRQEVLKLVREAALQAQGQLNLSATTVVLELTCGMCYALDDYTFYLTPSQLRELCDSLKGEIVGIGLKLDIQDGKLLILDVAPYSPAAEVMPPLLRDDHLLTIDKKNTQQLTLDAALELLEGQAGTEVELVVNSPKTGLRLIKLWRRGQLLPSVSYHLQSDGIGYLHLAAFQESTVQELDLALLALTKADMKALILDLRGNSGGVFEAAIDTARRFLTSGVIASTQHQESRYNTTYHARNSAALTLPLVVLIDGETASAAEVLAGALKENKRARLVGQPSFGKGCIQCVLKLPNATGGVPTGGLRVSVARFFSPAGQPYTGRGVAPHLLVDRFLGPEGTVVADLQFEQARLEAQRLLEWSPDGVSHRP